MTYEERLKHRELTDRVEGLRARFEGEGDASITRGEAQELLGIVTEIIAQLSPERWDRLMETVVDEASRRSGAASVAR